MFESTVDEHFYLKEPLRICKSAVGPGVNFLCPRLKVTAVLMPIAQDRIFQNK